MQNVCTDCTLWYVGYGFFAHWEAEKWCLYDDDDVSMAIRAENWTKSKLESHSQCVSGIRKSLEIIMILSYLFPYIFKIKLIGMYRIG